MEKAKEMLPLYREEITQLRNMHKYNSGKSKRALDKILSGIRIRLNQIRGKIEQLGKRHNIIIITFKEKGIEKFTLYSNLHVNDAPTVFDLDNRGRLKYITDIEIIEVEPGKSMTF